MMLVHPLPPPADFEETQFELPDLGPSTSSVLKEYRQRSAAAAPPPPPTTATRPQTDPQTGQFPLPEQPVYPVKIVEFNIDNIQIYVSNIQGIYTLVKFLFITLIRTI